MTLLIAIAILAGTGVQAVLYTREASDAIGRDRRGMALKDEYEKVDRALTAELKKADSLSEWDAAFETYHTALDALGIEWGQYANGAKNRLFWIAASWVLLAIGALLNLINVINMINASHH